MAVAIISCPSCRTLLLSDTAQCPSCQIVLDQDRLDSLADQANATTTKSHIEDDPEDECSSCGEMVRRGLVRCWNCSSFMRKEIAETYEDMRSNAEPIIYQPLPEFEGTIDAFDDDAIPLANYSEGEEEDDFEIDQVVVDEMARTDAATEAAKASNEQTYAVENAPAPDSENNDDEVSEQASPTAETTDTAAKSPDDAGKAEATDDDKKRATEVDKDAEDHSVATGGDVLLQVAIEQEAEREKRMKALGVSTKGPQLKPGNFLAFCPNGHRIEVGEKHRGKTGRCPRCQQPFVVPVKTWVEPKPEKKDEAKADENKAAVQSRCRLWLEDVQLHTVHPEKLKLKEGSLASAFEKRDLVFTEDGLVLIKFGAKKGGLFSKGSKADPEEIRQNVREHLDENKPLDKLPEGIVAQLIEASKVDTVRIVQPPTSDGESMFHGVDVFGKGRIAIKIPREEKGPESEFLTFALIAFRQVAEQMRTMFEMPEFGGGRDIPMANEFETAKCHYTDDEVKWIENIEYFEADPTLEVETSGRKCQECGIVVSEAARKKEKLGGSNGKAIAKAKCPKCEKKFGKITLLSVPSLLEADAKSDDDEAEPASEESEATSAKPEAATAGDNEEK